MLASRNIYSYRKQNYKNQTEIFMGLRYVVFHLLMISGPSRSENRSMLTAMFSKGGLNTNANSEIA